MKKTALTIGLFSLVMVAASFANPEASNKIIEINPPTGTGATNGGRQKADFAALRKSEVNSKHLNSFAADSQSKRMTVKVD
ncbi:hypothetical protein [Flavobacterium quisquiliarum]|jgi:hypothetical protein|uniref:Uncharacterized protein n=1 Tax=Flavobacterium quisquiliarum TaxID=1834436 RepID=A0ABV8WDR6_9FLAO|nr:hypothetical protein [Flavobacterium quisquiliarum]MBW1658331.1 hypothetical protein [Flavobacterium quisquiliarum]NWL02140.1 hypothetical protein [Flavobacterium collinsii]